MKTPQIAPLAGFAPLGFRSATREHLTSSQACMRGECDPATCSERFKQAPSGRWFVTMGHAGFNSRANNRDGFATLKAAEGSNRRYRTARARQRSEG